MLIFLQEFLWNIPYRQIISKFQATVEEWMKFTAASSYDYMKLIVMELQQKLVEQEELEKLQAQQQLRSKNLLILTDKALKSVKKITFSFKY